MGIGNIRMGYQIGSKPLALLFSNFFVSSGILIFCRSLRENNSFKVKNVNLRRKHTLRRPRWCGYVQSNQGDD